MCLRDDRSTLPSSCDVRTSRSRPVEHMSRKSRDRPHTQHILHNPSAYSRDGVWVAFLFLFLCVDLSMLLWSYLFIRKLCLCCTSFFFTFYFWKEKEKRERFVRFIPWKFHALSKISAAVAFGKTAAQFTVSPHNFFRDSDVDRAWAAQ